MIGRLKTYLRIIYTVKNWISFSISYLLNRESYIVVFRKGNVLHVKRESRGRDIKKIMNLVNFFRELPEGTVVGDKALIRAFDRNLSFDISEWLTNPDAEGVGPASLGEMFRLEPYKKLNAEPVSATSPLTFSFTNNGDVVIGFEHSFT